MSDILKQKISSLAQLYFSGDMVKTELACREILAEDSKSVIVLNILGAALRGQGRQQEAILVFDEVLEIEPDSVDTLNAHGGVLSDIGLFKDSIRSYERALEILPDNISVHFNLSNIKTFQTDYTLIDQMEVLYQ